MSKKDKSLGADGLLKASLKIVGGKLGQQRVSGRYKMYVCEPPNVETYVEPFLGSGNVLFGKRRHVNEVVGDISPYNINYFKAVQHYEQELLPHLLSAIKEFQDSPDPDQLFKEYRVNTPKLDMATEEGMLAWARWYYVINRLSRNGIVRFCKTKGLCNATYCKTTDGRGIVDEEYFDHVIDRAYNAEFLNVDYKFLLQYANGAVELPPSDKLIPNSRTAVPERTWVVLDPPYYEVFTKYDQVQFSPEDHAEMAILLKQAKYRWLLTINDTPEVRALYEGFHMIEHDIYYSCSNTPSGRGERPELIITNYPVDKEKWEAALWRHKMKGRGPRVKCLKCNKIIQSKHVHDFVRCKCKEDGVWVDGGPEYLRTNKPRNTEDVKWLD